MNLIWMIFLFAVGACVGSFLNVLIYRLPRGESIVFPGSHCPGCGRPIRWHDNIPLLSWLILGGHCRDCKTSISPRYFVIEAATALRVAGLFACYYVLHLRHGAGDFADTWPMFTAHAVLLCGLLVCSVVDLELYIVPLEVMWACSLVGMAAATFRSDPFLAPHHVLGITAGVSATTAAMSVAAVVGLLLGLLLVRRGFLQASFADVAESAVLSDEKKRPPATAAKPAAAPASLGRGLMLAPKMIYGIVTATLLGYVPEFRKDVEPEPAKNVPITAEHGVNPRREVLREVLFLLPAGVLAAGAAAMLHYCPTARSAWSGLFDPAVHPALAPHLSGLAASLFGYLIGGLWIWGTRILGTLGFGKEAMGMGDVHIMAAVGAVTGWIVPSIAFFVAPIIGLVMALYLVISRKQGFLAYGPWLATGSLVVMIFYDWFMQLLAPLFTVAPAWSL